MWTIEKINNQKDYFKSQRIEKTGNFTEYVVRTFYCIYKACDNNKTNYCLKDDVLPKKIKYIIYEGIYDVPDHDYSHVISNCFKTLNEMGYIEYKESMIIIKKQLDFLLDGEHESYLEKYDIKNSMSLDNEEIKNIKLDNKTNIKCLECQNGYYVLRKGPYNNFYGCSEFPKCKDTKSVADFMYLYLLQNGLNLYEEKVNCWKCGKEISVLSYFLDLDLKLYKVPIPSFDALEVVRLGMIEEIDEYLSKKYSTLKYRFSKKAGFSYTANVCPFCNNIQGTQMALGKVYNDLLKDLEENKLEYKIKEKILISRNLLPKEVIWEIVEAAMNSDRTSTF